jgi:sialic acid synthase SpsE
MSENRVYFIAEIGLNHNGDINLAHELIDIAAKAEVDAVKFQKRTISNLAIQSVLDQEDSRFPAFGSTYGDIRRYLEFDLEQYLNLQKHARQVQLDFIVTPFDETALDFLDPLNLDIFKIASHSVTNLDFLEKVAKKNKRIIMSTGMSHIEEIDTAVDLILRYNSKLQLLHCVSSYPTPIEHVNLNTIPFLKERYGLPVGYSGHETDFLASIAAVSLGASVVERHITTSKSLEGFDHKLSLDPSELTELVQTIRKIEIAVGVKQKKFHLIEQVARDKYNVSMVTSRKIEKGEKLCLDAITWKNPGTGIPRKDRDLYINKRVKQSLAEDVLIQKDMFE